MKSWKKSTINSQYKYWRSIKISNTPFMQNSHNSPIIVNFKSCLGYHLKGPGIRPSRIPVRGFFGQSSHKIRLIRIQIMNVSRNTYKVSYNKPCFRASHSMNSYSGRRRIEGTYSCAGVTSVRANRAVLIFSLRKNEACFLKSWNVGVGSFMLNIGLLLLPIIDIFLDMILIFLFI